MKFPRNASYGSPVRSFEKYTKFLGPQLRRTPGTCNECAPLHRQVQVHLPAGFRVMCPAGVYTILAAGAWWWHCIGFLDQTGMANATQTCLVVAYVLSVQEKMKD
eukprot:6209471-Pleurochrysis_carterae.AAC.2